MNAVGAPRVVFIGSEEIGWECLQTLLRIGANVVGVFTLDEAAGRRAVAFRSFAPFADSGVPVYFGDGTLAADDATAMRELAPDLIYEIGWSQLLPPDILAIPSAAAVGMHCSLLPKHRGRAPIPWSIIFGLQRSGMTLFHLSTGADRGDIIGQAEFAIGSDDTAGDVYGKSVQAAVSLVETYHPMLANGTSPRIPQDLRRSDSWPRRTPQDGLIDWEMSAVRLYDWVRALTHPFPGAFTYWGDRKVFVWKAQSTDGNYAEPSGTVVGTRSDRIVVTSGQGALAITSLQLDGGEELGAAAFVARHHLAVGEMFG